MVEKLELNSGIPVGVGLPCDIVGALLLPLESRIVIIIHNIIGIGIQIVADIIVALRTYADFQFQIVNLVDIEKLLIDDHQRSTG